MMRAANRKSWLPQPSRIPTTTSSDEQSGRRIVEDEFLQNQDALDRKDFRSDDRPVRRGTIVNKGSDTVISSKLDKTTAGTTDHAGHGLGAHEDTIHKRSLSIRSATGHSKTGSIGSSDKNSASHKSTPSREVKVSGRLARPARSGTLTGNSTAAQSRFGARPTSISTDPRTNTTNQTHHSAVKPSQARANGPVAATNNTAAASLDDSKAPQGHSHLQVELYQLSLYHEQACQAFGLWEADARKLIGDRHTQLGEMLREVVVLEQRRVKEANLDALARWLPDATDLLNKLQILSDVYHEALELTADGGEYTTTVLSFQDWILAAEECLSDTGASCIDRLPEDWRHSHASSALKVRSLQRELASLPAPLKSSLGDLMRYCGMLLDATLRELDLMSKLETVLCEADKARIEKAIQDNAMKHELLRAPQSPHLAWRSAS